MIEIPSEVSVCHVVKTTQKLATLANAKVGDFAYVSISKQVYCLAQYDPTDIRSWVMIQSNRAVDFQLRMLKENGSAKLMSMTISTIAMDAYIACNAIRAICDMIEADPTIPDGFVTLEHFNTGEMIVDTVETGTPTTKTRTVANKIVAKLLNRS